MFPDDQYPQGFRQPQAPQAQPGQRGPYQSPLQGWESLFPWLQIPDPGKMGLMGGDELMAYLPIEGQPMTPQQTMDFQYPGTGLSAGQPGMASFGSAPDFLALMEALSPRQYSQTLDMSRSMGGWGGGVYGT